MAIEIVDLPIKHCEFSYSLCVYQWVTILWDLKGLNYTLLLGHIWELKIDLYNHVF